MKFLIPVLLAMSSSIAVAKVDVVQTKSGKHYTGYLGPRPHDTGVVYFSPSTALRFMPENYDARDEGHVIPIVNQGSCGSCWAFSLTRSHAAAQSLAGKGLLDLSEQDYLVNDKEAYGCNGGFNQGNYAVKYGQALEADCPYKASGRYACNAPKAAKAISWGYVGARGRAPTADELRTAVYQYKTLSVTVSGSGGFGNVGSDGEMDSCGSRSINHMINIIGYRADGKFLLANSWGTGWGNKGFAWAKQGCNMVANTRDSALYFVAEGGPAPTPPKIQLPVEVTVIRGAEIPLGVKPQAGVTYAWSTGETTSLIYVSPTVDTTYTLTAKNAAGTATSAVLVRIEAAPAI